MSSPQMPFEGTTGQYDDGGHIFSCSWDLTYSNLSTTVDSLRLGHTAAQKEKQAKIRQ